MHNFQSQEQEHIHTNNDDIGKNHDSPLEFISQNELK